MSQLSEGTSHELDRPRMAWRRGRMRTSGRLIAAGLAAAALLGGALAWREAPVELAMIWGGAAMALLGAVAFSDVARVRRRYRALRGIRELEQRLRAVRLGTSPISLLEEPAGALSGVARQMRFALHELRQREADLALLNEEMRQRIAQRTSALERLVGGLRQQASRDPLTGLHNRRMLDDHLGTLLDNAQTAHSDLCLLMLDLDNFKLLNDTHGHAAGDEFLRNVGQLIRSCLREGDLAFRYGGDEFVVVLPRGGAAAGRAVTQRLTDLIDGLGRTIKLPQRLGCSVGVVALSEHPAPTRDALLRLVDERLYGTKRKRKQAA